MSSTISILVETPAHASLGSVLTYRAETPLPVGTLVRVPLGKRETLGVVWSKAAADEVLDSDKIRSIAGVLEGVAPLNPAWQQLIQFSASYYQRSVGEVALAALPPQLKNLTPTQMQRRLRITPAKGNPATDAAQPLEAQTVTPEQKAVLEQIASQPGPYLLHGVTGSGKTEVYLQAVQTLLDQNPQAQALVMVPEINLTPQLEQRFLARFAAQFGSSAVISMHSGLTPAQRLKSWLAAHQGEARIVLGTRMAVFASMPHLKLIVVDEEHDPSYKGNDGSRYSARDLALFRGKIEHAKVILGSATPSLESWHHSRPAAEGGRYLRLAMPSRVGQGILPMVRRVDMSHQPRHAVISPPLLQAITERVARGEQCMIFLNRRGYAPVLHCADCGWKSQCPHCSAFRVFHKIDRSLRCHHCGFADRVPRGCPDCGNVDISPIGRGTEQLEEHLAELMVDVKRPDGSALRIARIDADSTRHKGSLEQQLAAVHAGEVDILVGTQMIAKGHDFRRITLVAAINPDNALFSSDFRAPERLFSLLMQAAGRAGRDASLGNHSEMWIQSFQPAHPLYAALKQYDYAAFAQQQLQERSQAGMPPFSAQALVRAEARSQDSAQAFLNAARNAALNDMPLWEGWSTVLEHISLYSAVPMTVQRVANIERAQMLIESPSRPALQQFLTGWQQVLHDCRKLPECKGLIRWAIDIDPQSI